MHRKAPRQRWGVQTMTARRVLLVAFDDWYSTARLPATLQGAGFEVGVLSESGNFVAQSRHVDHRFLLDTRGVVRGRVESVLAAIESFVPDLIIPGDERATLLLRSLGATHQWQRPTPSLQALLRRSVGILGSSGHGGERVWMLNIAERLGITVPPHVRAPTLHDAVVFALEHGSPIFLKQDHTYGGQGVRLCADLAALETAYATFSRGHRLWSAHGLWRRARRAAQVVRGAANPLTPPIGTQGLSVEAAVPGRPAFFTGVALEGRALSGLAAEVEVHHPMPVGPSARIRLHHDPEMEEIAARLVKTLDHSGFYGIDFIRRRDGGLVFLEFNARPATAAHLGGLISADLGVALFAALAGQVPPSAGHAGEVRVALFPQDWIRAPDAYDRDKLHLDIPRGDPALLKALSRRLPKGVDRVAIERVSRGAVPEGGRRRG